MSKLTSVEWLVELLPTRVINSLQNEIDKAKKIHKQEIEEAFIDGFNEYYAYDSDAPTYYYQTFKKDKAT